jgi:hypothetical protein
VSYPALATVVPSELNASVFTRSVWPVSTFLGEPSATFHSRTVVSPADARYRPFGSNATLLTSSVWPARVLSRVWVATSQSTMVCPVPAAARIRPSGLNSTLFTVPP